MSYRKRALILGCSFTAGSYTWDPDNVIWHHVTQSDGSVKKIDSGVGRERLDTSHPWCRWLNPQDHYTVYGLPGAGIIQHATILEQYYITDKLKDFDYVVLQTTFEPRLTFSNPDVAFDDLFEPPREDHKPPDNITMWLPQGNGDTKIINFLNAHGNNANLGGNFTDSKHFVKQLFSGNTNRNAVQCAAELINHRCAELKIPLFIFNFGKWIEENTATCPNATVLPVPYAWGDGKDTMGIWMKKKYHVMGWIDPKINNRADLGPSNDMFVGHYNIQGNKVIGQHVRKALEKLT